MLDTEKELKGTHCRRILIVEDDPVSRTLMEEFLKLAGYESTSATNGAEALAILEETHFPIVITDIMMPALDGLQLCRAVRSRTSPGYIFIIILSIKDSKKEIIEGLEAGADEYLAKPVDQVELVARLNTANRILDLEDSLKKRLEEVWRLSVVDGLTGVFNRGYFYEHFNMELSRACRYGNDLSLVMCDIDHFKKVNDRWGHLTGDLVLKDVAQSLASAVRYDIDWVARYGGEEFVIVLPQTGFAGAEAVADRLREEIAAKRFDYMMQEGITVSFGVTAVSEKDRNQPVAVDTLVERVDRCLYRAKREGRNRVVGVNEFKKHMAVER